MRSPKFLALLFVVALAGGCATNRTIMLTTRPPDASIAIDGIDRGRAPVTETFSFNNDSEVHRVTAKRLGYKDKTVEIPRDYESPDLMINMQQQTRKINITVFPVPANIFVDGVQFTTEPVTALSPELAFTVDAKGDWTPHTVKAEQFGYPSQTINVSWTDRSTDYQFNLEPTRKDLSITTVPGNADVYLDAIYLGKSSATGVLKSPAQEFYPDLDTKTWKTRKLSATKAGYDPAEKQISWDNGQTDYSLNLTAKSKSLRIMTDPPGAIVKLDGTELHRDSVGASVMDRIEFTPDEKGVLKTYSGVATKKTSDSEWEPLPFTIAWDGGKTDYSLTLKEILIRPVPVLEAVWEHGDEGWSVRPRQRMTIGMKSIAEGPESRQPVLLTHLEKGAMIDTLDVSPDGSQLLFTVLSGKDRNSFHSQMYMVRTDGGGAVASLTNGHSLDLTPAFSPAGDQIAFASDRFGKNLSICTISATGAPGIKQLTSGDNNVLWPSIDSEPQPRLFYQAFVDSDPLPRLWDNQIGGTIRTDLTVSGSEPHISPRDDSVLFVGVNDKTQKRDIFRVSDKGGVPENLTNTPDDDEYNPAWSHDGGRIAYVAERASGGADGSNADIYVLDLSHNDKPTQITSNTSVDDHPVWDPSGNAIYFRSNRGGQWGIWKIVIR